MTVSSASRLAVAPGLAVSSRSRSVSVTLWCGDRAGSERGRAAD